MGVTLARRCTDSAISLCWLAMEYRGKWRWWRGEQLRNILQHKYYPNLLLWWSPLDYTHSERQEQKIYEELIRTTPGIKERLVNSSEEEIMYIADQASLSEFLFTKLSFLLSFAGECPVPGETTHKVLRVPFLTGSLLKDRLWILHWFETRKMIVASTMRPLALCFAQSIWTGLMLSKLFCLFTVVTVFV